MPKLQTLGSKNYRQYFEKKKSNAEVFLVQNIYNVTYEYENRSKESQKEACPRLSRLLQKFNKLFIDDLPDGSPLKRSVDQGIKLKENAIPPRMPSFQLSRAQLRATTDYISKYLKSGNLRSSKSPYGASLFFVRKKGELRGIIEYKALNLIRRKIMHKYRG